MPKSILITGGSGLIGKALSEELISSGYEVRWLTRKVDSNSAIKQFEWDVVNKKIDPNAAKDVFAIIHLAGASVAGNPWTRSYKKVLKDSRIDSCNLLLKACEEADHYPDIFISSSAIGYYGENSGDDWQYEGQEAGEDFLAKLTYDWEKVTEQFLGKVNHLIRFRTGIVLSDNGGTLSKMLPPVKMGLGSALGSGKQFMSWIHIADVVNAYKYALEKSLDGTFNLVAPNPVRNKEFMKELAKVTNRPFFLPNVPSFMLKWVMGEMAGIVLGSIRASSNKLSEQGFPFIFEDLSSGLNDLLKK